MQILKMIKIITILCCVIFSNSYSQENKSIDYNKYISIVNEASMSAVFIQTPERYGTGSFFGVPFSDTSTVGTVMVVTAKHVLFKYDSLGNVVGKYDNATITLMTREGNKELREYALVYEDSLLDIAVLSPKLRLRSFSEYQTFVPFINDISKFTEIKKGLTAFIAGFPFRIGLTSLDMNPVLQSGIVSYVDTINSLVLIDIPVNPGNSGCPVYILCTDGLVKLLGLVFQYEPSREDIVFRTSIGKTVPANSSLGRVVLLRTIIPTVEKMVQD